MVRKAIKAFWFRALGWRFFAALVCVLVSLIYFVWMGDRSWWIGVMASIVVMGIGFSAAMYVVHFRVSIGKFRKMSVPEATLELGDERFRITSNIGSTELSWSTVIEIWQFPEFWLLFFSKAQFVTISLADLDSEARDLILDRARSHGAKVS